MFDDQSLTDESPATRPSSRSLLRRAAPVVALAAIAVAAPLASEEIVVRKGQTLGGIAAEEGVAVTRLAAFNGIANPNLIFEGQVLRIPPAEGELDYVIAPGDTLGALAKRFDTTVGAIAARNGLTDANRIVAGRTIVIPQGTAAAASPSPTAKSAEAESTEAEPQEAASNEAGSTAPAPTTTAPPPTTAPPATTAAPATTAPPATTAAPVTTAPPVTTVAPTTTPPATSTPAPAPGVVVSTIWVVQPGDTLASVASKVGLTAVRLAEANRMAPDAALTPGQYLFVPQR